MIKVSVMYPNSSEATFDVDYYCAKHLPMVAQLLGDALKGGSVDSGLAGGAAGEPAAYIAMGHLTFDSVAAFQQSFEPHADKILSDIPNFTNTQPAIQISEIML